MMMWLSLTSVVAQRSQRRRAGLTRHTRHANIFLLLFTVCVWVYCVRFTDALCETLEYCTLFAANIALFA